MFVLTKRVQVLFLALLRVSLVLGRHPLDWVVIRSQVVEENYLLVPVVQVIIQVTLLVAIASLVLLI